MLACALAGCATFEDPTIVLDARVIGMTARVPEHVIDVDLAHPPAAAALLVQLNAMGPQIVCGTVADPGTARGLGWTMTACALDDNSRCDLALPRVALGAGRLEDPEAPQGGPGYTAGTACVVFSYEDELLALLVKQLASDPARAVGGLDYAIEMRVMPDGAPSELYATKKVRIAPRDPPTREPNRNPVISEIQVARNYGGGFTVQPKHCADPPGPMGIDVDAQPGDVVTLYPVEGNGAREQYVVPTLDGQYAKLTENMTYQWLTTAGSLSDDVTGGPPDIFGNLTLLGTDWTAPNVRETTRFPVWVIQRDERFGASLREVCIRVTP